MTPTAKLIQEQVRAWQGVSLSDSRAEALASIAATMRQATAEAVDGLSLEDGPGEFEARLASSRRPRR